MEVVPIPTSRWHSNPLYPLPPNYAEIASDNPDLGRQLRVNACRQWLLPRPVIHEILSLSIPSYPSLPAHEQGLLIQEYKGEAFLACVRFFDEYYLKPDGDFDPGFYDAPPVPSAPFHLEMIRGWGMHAATLDVCPRGSAKSMHVRKAICLSLISRPSYKILYCTSSDKNATETSTLVRAQLYTNPRIQEDWAPEMPSNRIKPFRGDLPTGIEWFTLDNMSQLVTFSIGSKMRGGRPLWFILDDPEYDPHASTSMAERRSFMRERIFKVAMPMLMRSQARISWLATFVSKRHYAWLAFETDKVMRNGAIVETARIPEFDYWHRRLVTLLEDTPSGLQSCWPHMWPLDSAERDALHLDPATKTVADIKRLVPPAVFASEYMGKPGESTDSYFRLSETSHSWWFDRNTIDDLAFKEPRSSTASIKWRNGDVECSLPIQDFLSQSRLFITIDTSKTARSDSDYKVATLQAVTPDHDLFVLDQWAAQCHPERLILAAFDMAKKWQCRYIYIEGITDGIVVARSMNNLVRRLISSGTPSASLPIIRTFNPGQTPKSTKISALVMRFEHGKIKLPFPLRLQKPWCDLFEQIEGFNPDVEDGGLQHDDHLDTLSMSEYVLPSVRRVSPGEEPEETDVLKLLERGDTHSKSGLPLVAFLDFNQNAPRLLEIMKTRHKNLPKEHTLA